MNPGVIADAVLVVHAFFVIFVVLGFALILVGLARDWRFVRNPVFRYAHVAAIGFVVVQVWLGIECPLTTLENVWRVRAGEAGYRTSFIEYWLYRLLYYRADPTVFTVIYSVFGIAVALVWWYAPPVRRRSPDDRLD